MKAIKYSTFLLFAFAFISCCPCRKSKSAHILFHGTEWQLAQLYGETVDSDNYRITFAADGSVSGTGGCNNFAGTFTQNVTQIKIADNLVSTRMHCPDQQREDKFLKMLTLTDAYSIDGLRLMLIRSGEVLAIFDPTGDYEVIPPKKHDKGSI